MLEVIFCSMLTILPDFLFRRYAQGKRWGREINIFSMWYELRWGIVACAILTISLITTIFYYHPSTTASTSYFRTVTILSEGAGRVAEVYVRNNEKVEAGAPLFRLDDARQRSAADTARAKIEEIAAAELMAQSELAAAEGVIGQAEGALKQAQDELDTKQALAERGSAAVTAREIERLQNTVASRRGAVEAATAQRDAVTTKIRTLLPAQRASAEAALAQAQVELDKTTVFAGVTGTVQQFALQPGDLVNPILRPAGILVPDVPARRFQAGFSQLTAQVIKPGTIAEISCATKPFTIIPMVVVEVQDVIAAGQMRPTDQLIDVAARKQPGSLTVYMEPLYAGQADDIPPGSACAANAYTNNHDRLVNEDLGLGEYIFLHAIDATGLVHAAILRIQALLLLPRTLVLSGH